MPGAKDISLNTRDCPVFLSWSASKMESLVKSKVPCITFGEITIDDIELLFKKLPGGKNVKNLPDNAGDAGEVGSRSGSGIQPG